MNIEREKIARMYRALGSPQRLALFERLRAAGAACQPGKPGELCVCDIAKGMPLTLSTVSHHLKELKDAGLVRCEKRGQWVYCTVNEDALTQLQAFLLRPIAHTRKAA